MLLFIFHRQYENSYIKIQQFRCFLKCTLTKQLSQYNLIKLFQMKLKTTKYHQIYLTEKAKLTFQPIQHVPLRRN